MPYAYPPVLVLCFLILVPFLKLIFLLFSCPSYSFRPRAHPLSYCFFRCAVAFLFEVGSVRLSVRPSVRRSVRPSRVIFEVDKFIY